MFKVMAAGVAAILLLLGATTISTTRKQGRPDESERSQERGTLTWFAKRANARGERRAVKAAPLTSYVTDVKDIDEVASNYHLAVVLPVKSTAVAKNDSLILTWYKLKVVEDLSRQKISRCSACPLPVSIPQDMLPVLPDELLVTKFGGTVSIDGVEVTMEDKEFPPLSLSEKYLLFFETDPTGTIGDLMLGPGGVFVVRGDDSLTPLTDKGHDLSNHVRQRAGNSLRSLAEAVKGGSRAR
jgi:hypothetical protein